MSDDFKGPWPWNRLLTAHFPPLPSVPSARVKDAPTPTLTGYYAEGRCPRCSQRNPPSLFGYCVTCHEQDQIEQSAKDRHYLKPEDLV